MLRPILSSLRMHLISMGQTGIIADLRKLNCGRPGVNDPFFKKLEEVAEEATAVDDRRHNVAQLSEWISLKELCSKAAERCADGIPVPSVSLARLQFIPQNPYAHSALNFTSCIPVQYKIPRRQLRVQHPDGDFCAAQLKYLKEKAVEMRGECRVLVLTRPRYPFVNRMLQCPHVSEERRSPTAVLHPVDNNNI